MAPAVVRRIVVITLVLGMAALLWNALFRSNDRTATTDLSVYTCLESSIRRQIPTGATVYVAHANDAFRHPRSHERNEQIVLTPMLTPWYRLVAQPRPGVYVASLVSTAGSARSCGGRTLKVGKR